MNESFDELDRLGQLGDKEAAPSGFIPSRWETVDPDQVEAQAMTTSKWDQIENTVEDGSMDSSQNDTQTDDASDSRFVPITKDI